MPISPARPPEVIRVFSRKTGVGGRGEMAAQGGVWREGAVGQGCGLPLGARRGNVPDRKDAAVLMPLF